MAITWLTPSNVTPGSSGSWQDVDVSASVPAGATGVILQYVNIITGNYSTGFRKNGSTDERPTNSYAGHFWCAVGVDANRIFEAYIGSTSYIDIYLIGYLTSESVFFDNGVDKSLGSTGSWEDIDISGDTGADTATGAIFEISQSNYGYNWGFRKNGSTDSRIYDSDRHCGFIIGVDGSEICEGQISNTGADFFLLGYIKSGITFNTNATDISLAETASWTDLTALPAGATGGLIEAISSNFAYTFGLRENGSADDIKRACAGEQHSFGISKCDGDLLIEGYISNTGVDFFLVGYSTSGGSDQTVTPDAVTLSLNQGDQDELFDYLLEPAAIDLTITLKSPELFAGVLINPSTLSLATLIEDPSISFDYNFSTSAVDLTLAVKSPSENYDGLFVISALTLTTTVEEPIVTGSGSYSPSALALISVLKDPVIDYPSSEIVLVTVIPLVLDVGTATIPVYTEIYKTLKIKSTTASLNYFSTSANLKAKNSTAELLAESTSKTLKAKASTVTLQSE